MSEISNAATPGGIGNVSVVFAIADADVALKIDTSLELAGIRCVLASLTGERDALREIESAAALVLLFSPSADAETRILHEVRHAQEHGVALVPVRLTDASISGELQFLTEGLEWIDAHRTPIENLIDALRTRLETLSVKNDLTALKIVRPPKDASRTERPTRKIPRRSIRDRRLPDDELPQPPEVLDSRAEPASPMAYEADLPGALVAALVEARRDHDPPATVGETLGDRAATVPSARPVPGSSARMPVDCSVFAPSEISRDGAMLVQVFVHAPEVDERVAAMAAEVDKAAARRGFKPLSIGVALGGRIAFSLQAAGLHVVDTEALQVVWQGRTQAVQFLVTAPADAALGPKIATMRVAIDGMPAGFIRFMIDVKAVAKPESNPSGDPVNYAKAFVCYASPDRDEVLKRVQGVQVSGIDCFMDVLRLRPGQVWEPDLYRRIDSSDLFLLFWSTNARESEWVRKEVLYALERQAGDPKSQPQIVPILLEGPPPVQPPPELAHLHFNDSILYAMSNSAPGRSP